MSEQQQLHQPNLFTSQTIGRTQEACMVPMFYQHPTNPRLDGVNFPSNIAHVPNAPFYPMYPIRSAAQQLLMPLTQSAMLCAYGSAIPDTQIHGHIPNTTQDYGQSMPQPPYQHHLPFSHIPQGAQAQSSTAAVLQRPLSVSASTASPSKPMKRREKCPLVVRDPVTGVTVDLESTSDSGRLDSVASESKVTVNTPDAANAMASPDEHVSEVLTETVAHPATNSVASSSLTVPAFEPDEDIVDVPIDPDKAQVSAELLLDDTAIDNRDHVIQTRLEVELADECVESDENDEDEVSYRRRYSRETLLSLKSGPVSRTSLPNLAVLPNISHQWKYRRYPNKAPPREIKLPTGITVKTVEGAFVPTSLRKKEEITDNDKPKQLSRELNVILNRVSDGNLVETVADIKKLELTSVEDMQLLSKLVFQKGIRQSKYSKVFATLCKELKGFSVPESEPLESLVLNQVRELFNTPLDTLISDLNVAIDAKIAAAKDEAVKRILDEDRETSILKKKEAYDGNTTLFAELFLCQLVTLRTMTECLRKLRESSAPEALRSMLIILRICGPDLDTQAKSHVDACFNRLNGHVTSNKLPTHQVFHIQELCDLRERGWKELVHNQSSRRLPDDKTRRFLVPAASETKRRSVQSTNAVTPSTLAFSQQSHDPLKLVPIKSNWAHGSGQLNDEENHLQNPKSTSHPVSSGRSRETSPYVPSGPLGAWGQRKTSNPAAVSKTAKPVENYGSVLDRCRGLARATVQLVSSREDNVLAPVEDCAVEDRSALLHLVFESLMDKSPEERSAAGALCLRLLQKKLITPADMLAACRAYFSTLDDDWLEDYPFGWKYLAEIFQQLIQNGPDYFQLLTSILQPLHSGGRGAKVFAFCLKMSADRLGSDLVSFKFQSMRLDWAQLGISPNDVQSFTRDHSILFTTEPNPLVKKLNQIKSLAQSSSTSLEQFNELFKQLQLPQSELPYGFIRQCTTILVKHKDLNRQSIDQRALALGLLVDHNPDRESQVLQALDDCSKIPVPIEQWQRSLLEKNVISSEAFKSWGSSIDCKGSMGKKVIVSE